MNDHTLKKKIKSSQLTIGSWITLAHPGVPEIMSQSDFDWLVIDMEHSAISISQAEELIRVIDLCNISPLVRLTSIDDSQIKRVMDSGAHGIIVPMVNSFEDAKKAINAAYFSPKGNRSYGLARAQGYGTRFNDYLENSAENTVIVVQIEHIDAIDNLEEIFSIEEVDAYIIGPYDLSGSMGIPGDFQNNKYIEVINTINQAATKAGIPGGIHIVEPNPNQLRKAIKDDYKFIAYSVDFRMLDTVCSSGLASIDDLK